MVLVRKSIGVGPFRLTLSPKGLGGSIGGRFARVQSSIFGTRFTLRVPGTGLYLKRAIRRHR